MNAVSLKTGKIETHDGGVHRKPRQERSKASQERMLSTAKALMTEQGNEDFTLIEVSKRGKVSIGSIYLRYESKDHLVRAVLAQGMADLAKAEDVMLAELKENCRELADFVPKFVEAYAGMLTEHAPLLRLAMMRAEHDPLVAIPGKKAAERASAAALEAMLRYANEIGGDKPEKRAMAAYQVVFSTLARELSLGSSRESVTSYDWDEMKVELGVMCLAYLKAP
jgi:AcrR family transcriptional regulator